MRLPVAEVNHCVKSIYFLHNCPPSSHLLHLRLNNYVQGCSDTEQWGPKPGPPVLLADRGKDISGRLHVASLGQIISPARETFYKEGKGAIFFFFCPERDWKKKKQTCIANLLQVKQIYSCPPKKVKKYLVLFIRGEKRIVWICPYSWAGL